MKTLDFGIVTFFVPTPLIFCIALAIFLLTGFFWLLFALWWKRQRQEQQQDRPAAPVPVRMIESVKTIQEIYIHDGRFMLQGIDWQWLADQPVSYICPRCGLPDDITLRLYLYVPSGHIFLIGKHACTQPAISLRDTEALPVVEGGF